MTPQRIARSVELNVALIVANIAWGYYLVSTPRIEFERSVIWEGALGATPSGDPKLFGMAFLVAGVLLLAGQRIDLPLYAGFLLALGTWGVMTYSFAFSAIVNRPDEGFSPGLGFGGFISGGLTVFLHLFALGFRK